MFPVLLREATSFCVSNHCWYRKHRIVAGNLIDLRVEKFKQKGDKQAEAWTFLAMFDQDSAVVDQLCNCFFLWFNSGSLLNEDLRETLEGLGCKAVQILLYQCWSDPAKGPSFGFVGCRVLGQQWEGWGEGCHPCHEWCSGRKLIKTERWQALKLAEESLALFREVSSYVLTMKVATKLA